MSLFEKLFPKKKPSSELAVAETPVKEQEMYPGYVVQYYPYSGFYFAVHKGRLLKKWFDSGLVKYALNNDISFATNCNSEQEAWKLVVMHIEQRTKANVKVLKTPTYLLKSKDGNTIDI